MGAGALLALMARHSLLPSRQLSKLAPADISLLDSERPSHAQLSENQQPHLAESSLHQVLGTFHWDLTERLQQLQLLGNGNAHLNWLLDAFSSTISTYASLQSSLTTAADSSSGASLVKHRADEVLHLLDVCTALKQVADDLDHHFDRLQYSLQSVGQALTSNQSLASGRLRAAAHRLSVCLSQEQPHTCVTGKQLYRPLAQARTSLLLAAKSKELQFATNLAEPAAAILNQALDGTLLTSLLVLATAVSSLEQPSPRKYAGTLLRVSKMISKCLSAKSLSTPSWAAPLRRLRQDLREEINAAGGSLFRELRGLQSAATELHTTITTSSTHVIQVSVVKQSVESLGKSLREVQLCTSMLRTQLASLFEALIRLRLTFLDS